MIDYFNLIKKYTETEEDEIENELIKSIKNSKNNNELLFILICFALNIDYKEIMKNLKCFSNDTSLHKTLIQMCLNRIDLNVLEIEKEMDNVEDYVYELYKLFNEYNNIVHYVYKGEKDRTVSINELKRYRNRYEDDVFNIKEILTWFREEYTIVDGEKTLSAEYIQIDILEKLLVRGFSGMFCFNPHGHEEENIIDFFREGKEDSFNSMIGYIEECRKEKIIEICL